MLNSLCRVFFFLSFDFFGESFMRSYLISGLFVYNEWINMSFFGWLAIFWEFYLFFSFLLIFQYLEFLLILFLSNWIIVYKL